MTDTAVRKDGFASPAEACAFLSLSRSTLYLLMTRGEIPYRKIGDSRRIPWTFLYSLADETAQRARAG